MFGKPLRKSGCRIICAGTLTPSRQLMDDGQRTACPADMRPETGAGLEFPNQYVTLACDESRLDKYPGTLLKDGYRGGGKDKNMDYSGFFASALNKLRDERRYR